MGFEVGGRIGELGGTMDEVALTSVLRCIESQSSKYTKESSRSLMNCSKQVDSSPTRFCPSSYSLSTHIKTRGSHSSSLPTRARNPKPEIQPDLFPQQSRKSEALRCAITGPGLDLPWSTTAPPHPAESQPKRESGPRVMRAMRAIFSDADGIGVGGDGYHDHWKLAKRKNSIHKCCILS